MKKITIISIILLMFGQIFGQNEVDAFRFTEGFFTGTARSMAMGNAFGALGADLSVASTNPAGIGLYKHYEMTFSPSLLYSGVSSNYGGTIATNDKLSMMMNNMGISFGINSENDEFKALNFSVGYNRYNNFKRNTTISGVNNYGSMLDAFMLSANGYTPNQLSSYTDFLAWDTYLLETTSDDLHYTNPLWWTHSGDTTPVYGENIQKIVQESGGAGEYFCNAAINFKDLIYFGVTIGFPTFNYHSLANYSEDNFVDNDDLNSFTFNEIINDQGSGINGKFGLIVRPVDFIRFGAAIQTPTYYTITDVYSTSMHSYWNSADTLGYYDYLSESDVNNWRYHLLTPMRLNGDIGIIIAKIAAIDVNYEYIDYSTMRMSAPDYLFTNENNAIRDKFQAVSNYRAGGEINLGPLSLRAGYQLFGNPYKATTGIKYEQSTISGGIGIKIENIYMDFAYMKSTKTYSYFLYNGYSDEPVPEITTNDNIYNLTLGIKF